MANTYSKEQELLIDQDRGKPWKQIFWHTEDLSITSSWYHSKWHQEGPLGYVVFTFPINYSSRYLNNTAYLADMLQATWHIAEGN